MTHAKPLWVAALLTVVAYGIGLTGPLLFDDWANLLEIRGWLNGQVDFADAMLVDSGPLMRPIPMLSFLLDAWMSGLWPVQMKAVNLVLHLGIGWLLYQWLSKVLALAAPGTRQTPWLAALMVGLWWVHPLQVSTVLYVVQRMAQFSTLFMVLSMLLYLRARLAWKAQQTGRAQRGLLVWVPLCLLFGVLSKENAAVIPLLLLWIEWVLFDREGSEQRYLRRYFGVMVGLPAVAFVALLWWSPDRLLGSYAAREFAVWERLLTQPRVLMDYLQQMLFPRVGRMGLYYDDYAASTGMTSPWSTLWAWLGLLALIAIALLVRRRSPLLSLGIGLILIPQAVESTAFSLELYFEHRNYLSLMGVILCVYAVVEKATARLTSPVRSMQWAGGLLVSGILVAFGLTLTKAWTWTDKASIAEEGVVHHPNSLRANLDLANTYMAAGAFQSARELLRSLEGSPRPVNQFSAALGVMTVDCIASQQITAVGTEQALAVFEGVITLQHYQAANLLARTRQTQACSGVSNAELAVFLDEILARSSAQPNTSDPKRRVLQLSAITWTNAGNVESAADRYETLVQSSPGFDALVGYTQFQSRQDRRDLAEKGLRLLNELVPAWFSRKQARLQRLEHELQNRADAD